MSYLYPVTNLIDAIRQGFSEYTIGQMIVDARTYVQGTGYPGEYTMPQPTQDGFTMATAAADCGNFLAPKALADLGYDLDAADQNGNTPLALAMHKQHLSCFGALIAAGATVDADILHDIVHCRATAYAEKVAKLDAYSDARDEFGNTPFMAALKNASHGVAMQWVNVADLHAVNNAGETVQDLLKLYEFKPLSDAVHKRLSAETADNLAQQFNSRNSGGAALGFDFGADDDQPSTSPRPTPGLSTEP